jgi:hypothetical protein
MMHTGKKRRRGKDWVLRVKAEAAGLIDFNNKLI